MSETKKEVTNEALTTAQRIQKKMSMRRNKAKIKMGRKRAERRKANPEKLKKRAQRQARTLLLKRILKNKSKKDLSYSARGAIEKRLNKRKSAISRIAKRILPKVRKAEIDRFRGKGKVSVKREDFIPLSFSDFINEDTNNEITLVWGRLNPPTIGHGKVFDVAARTSKKYRIYLTQTTDSKKNPLSYQDKIKFAREMFPKHARAIIADKSIRNLFDLLTKIYAEGFTKVNLVAGQDRIGEYEALTSKYNGKKAAHGFYNFDGGVRIVSAGNRDPDSDGIEGMSASKLRKFAVEDDYQSFVKGLPVGYKKSKELYNAIRTGLNIKESSDNPNHIDMGYVSEERQAFIHGDLFDVDDVVIVKESKEIVTIVHLGSNYVIVENADGKKSRKWIESVTKLNENAISIGSGPGDLNYQYNSTTKKFTTHTNVGGGWKVTPHSKDEILDLVKNRKIRLSTQGKDLFKKELRGIQIMPGLKKGIKK